MMPEAIQTLTRSSSSDFMNSASNHKLGKELNKRLEIARSKFLDFLKAHDHYQFIFTSSATESNNMVAKGLALNPQDQIFICLADHPSLIKPWDSKLLHQVEVQEIPWKKNGQIDITTLIKTLTINTRLISLAQVNNHCGSLHDVISIAKQVKKIHPHIHFHVDAAQSFAKIPFQLHPSIDTLSISAHKMGGPKGIAGLYIKKGIKLDPLMEGGGHELALRPSTIACPLAFSFLKAAELRFAKLTETYTRLLELHNYLIRSLKEQIPVVKVHFIDEEDSVVSPYITLIILPDVSADIVIRNLQDKNIFVSTNAACSSRIKDDNPAYRVLHIPNKYRKNLIRISIAPETTSDQIDYLVSNLKEVYSDLHSILE